MKLTAPFPWFGGKSKVADIIWQRFGAVDNYVEPFFGSGAVLLARPKPFKGVETINDADGFVSNFWRAVKLAPDDVAQWADWPVNETDKSARHYWLVTEGAKRLADGLGDPDWFDAKIAGWWVWGLCTWIGGGWCSGDGPWQWTKDGWDNGGTGLGITRQLPHLGTGIGINRQLQHLCTEMGINRQLPHIGTERVEVIKVWFSALSARLRDVRVANGDWSRVTGDSVTWRNGRTAVFLDPPYSMDGRSEVYAMDCGEVAAMAREWAIEAGRRDDMLICLAGYDGEHAMPDGWQAHRWKAQGGFGNQGNGQGRKNAIRETLWFSPACNRPMQEGFDL